MRTLRQPVAFPAALLALAVAGGPSAGAAPRQPAATGLPYASEWRPFGLQGLTIRSLAAAVDLLCAGTQGEGIFCLDLASARPVWRRGGLDGRVVTWLWIDPLDPQVRFAAVDPGLAGPPLYRSRDGGAAWEPIEDLPTPFGSAPRVYAVQGVAGTGTVFAAGGGMWRSDDLGISWRALPPDGGLVCLEVARTDPDSVWIGGETLIFMGFTLHSRDGGESWRSVWDSRAIGDNQTSDVSAHPHRHGLVLTGHEGFVLRTRDDGDRFEEVLAAPARFFLDWDGANPDRAYAAGSPNQQAGFAFVSRDLGATWTDVTGSALAGRIVFRVEADAVRLGVAYAATDDGVYRFYGGGLPLCLDSLLGLDRIRLWPGACPPILAPVPAIQGDAVAVDAGAIGPGTSGIDLGEAECLIDGGDVAFATIDVPEPAPGRAVAILVRNAGELDYGRSSDGRRRSPSRGDCR
ncbi:MAG: WD40/YVTN/BNR-like repeat-containing protein [Acidobacteriota bacterium]